LKRGEKGEPVQPGKDKWASLAEKSKEKPHYSLVESTKRRGEEDVTQKLKKKYENCGKKKAGRGRQIGSEREDEKDADP